MADEYLVSKDATSIKPKKFPPTSFIVQITDLEPLFSSQGPRYDANNEWVPPLFANDMHAANGRWFRWIDGWMQAVNVRELASTGFPTMQHHVGSVLTRGVSERLLVSDIDVSEHDLEDHGGWKRLGFYHRRVSPMEPRHYTVLDFRGTMRVTAAPMSQHYTPQLLPFTYSFFRY